MLTVIAAASVSSLCAVAALLLIGLQRVERLSKPLALTAAGLLLTLAFAHLLPEAMHSGADAHALGFTALSCILLLSFLEMYFASGKEQSRGQHSHTISSGASGLLCGTLLHTFCDGVMIASAFATDLNLGIAVTAAIFAHELPQELGDYALLLECGLNKVQAFAVNLTALCGMNAGAICVSLTLAWLDSLLPYALIISAACFIYVALSDLLPRVRHTKNKSQLLKRLFCLCLGVLLALALCHH